MRRMPLYAHTERSDASAFKVQLATPRRGIRKDAEEKIEGGRFEFWIREKFLFSLGASKKNGFFLAPTPPSLIVLKFQRACLNF